MSQRSLFFVTPLLLMITLTGISSTGPSRSANKPRRRPRSRARRRWHFAGPVLVCRSCGKAIALTEELRQVLSSSRARCPRCGRLFTKAW